MKLGRAQIFADHNSEGVDRTLQVMGLTVRRTPVRALQANSVL